MAKRITPVQTAPKTAKSATKIFQLPELGEKGFLLLRDFRLQALVIGILVFGFYINSRNNEYALDDDIVMRQNAYVQKGFGGIGDILGNDAYKSFYESMGVDQQLSGGRYRPLSIVSFAIEQQLFGECYGVRYEEVRDSLFEIQKIGISDIGSQARLINEKNELEKNIKESNLAIAGARHIMQVLWFLLSMIVVLRFLRNHIFRENTDLAFLTTILFVMHPIHTEVIANVKSRDEIFSLLFIVLTLDYFFRYDLSKKTRDMVYGLVFFLLAFLSKEYAIMLFVLIPAGLMIFHKRKLSDLVSKLIVPFAAIGFTYLFIRLGVGGLKGGPIDKKSLDPLNEPYLFAKGPQELLSKINRLDDYVWLLIFPFPLAADYSYQHFPYSNITDPGVYLSIAVMIGMIYGTWKLWKRRHPMAFAMIFFFGFFFLINNIVFDIGATMGERLIYHSSLGFCMILAWGIYWLAERLDEQKAKILVVGIVVAIGIPSCMLTLERNVEWKNDGTLFITDVKKHPNSALCNGNAGARYMDRGITFLYGDSANQDSVTYYANIAIGYLQKSVELHPRYANGWLNLGLCYYNKKDFANAANAWEKAYIIFPNNRILQSYAQMLVGNANEKASNKDFAGSAEFFNYALKSYPADAKIWADYAGASFMAQQFGPAQNAFNEAYNRTTDPKLKENLAQGYRAAHYNDSVQTKWMGDSLNPDNSIAVVKGLIGTPDFYPQSRRLLEKALVLRPGDPGATRLLDSLAGLEKMIVVPQTIKPDSLK